MTPVSPIILHPNVGQFVHTLSHNALKMLIKVGENVYKTNNKTKNRTPAAHVLINRNVLIAQCGFTDEQEWESVCKELEEHKLLRVEERSALNIDRYFLTTPGKTEIKEMVFYTTGQIPKRFKGDNK